MKEINISCTPVHGFEEKSKFHVPGYMDLKKKQNIMYPGTWIWRKNKIPCTGVHEILISFTILMCSSGGGGPGFYFFIFLAIFFNMLKFFSIFGILKRSRWQNLSQTKQVKIAKLAFLDRTIRKVRNWNRKWVPIDGTPCM